MKPTASWRDMRTLNSPADLADLIDNIAEAVRTGELRQVTPPGAPFVTTDDIRDIPARGPWPDYLELHFEDSQTCERYRLIAETYHGCGGRWEEVP